MERIGRYILVRKIASGGMAEIWLAKLVGAAGFEKEVVIKKILPQWSADRDFVRMLIDEAKIVVQLTHPNIVQVYELAREGEYFYIAMEYLNGVDLRRLLQKVILKKKRVPVEVSLFIITQVLEGLSYAHSKKDSQGSDLRIVHRDISPQNILLSFDGTVKLTDFGIAKAASRTHETQTGVLKGKFAYMSPEQANQDDLDARSDLFSTGVVLYEMLTAERLFYRGSDLETIDLVRMGIVNPTPETLKKIPEKLQPILFKALAANREDRYPDVESFREDLLKFARRSKKNLKRERLKLFLETLFGKEKEEAEAVRKTDETRLLDPSTKMLITETKTVPEKEILVEWNETVVLPEITEATAPTIFPSEEKTFLKAGPKTVLVILSIMMIYSMITVWGFWPKIKSYFGKEAAQETVKITDLPKQLESKRIAPPEVMAPVSAKNVLAPVENKEEMSPETQKISEAPVVTITKEEPKKTTEGKDDKPLASIADKSSEAPISPKPEGKGYLSVQAIPWGSVTIDGGGKRWETPIRGIPLEAGTHSVRVRYDPDGSMVSTTVNITPGRERSCVASFRGKKEIKCKK